MRRLRPLRRRERERQENYVADLPGEEDENNDFVPFVPVSAERLYGDETEIEPSRGRLRLPRPHIHVPQPRLSRIALPRPSFGIEIHFGLLLIVILLIVGGIFGTLLNQGRIRDDVEHWWPAAVIAGALVWLLVVLVQRRIAAFLGAAAALGIGLSLLMDTQDIAPLDDTLLGVVLVSVGLGIVIRGFLLRQQNLT
jgi:hypothetical protein